MSLDYSLIALNLGVPFKLASTDLEHDRFSADSQNLVIASNQKLSSIPLTLNGVLVQGCETLNNYLKSHPQVAQDVKVCQ